MFGRRGLGNQLVLYCVQGSGGGFTERLIGSKPSIYQRAIYVIQARGRGFDGIKLRTRAEPCHR